MLLSHASHTHAWHSRGLLDGSVAHMANHSSRAEVFFKGTRQQHEAGLSPQGSAAVWAGEAKLLLAFERQTYQLLSRNSPHLPPPPPPHHLPLPSITLGAAAGVTGPRPWPWELHKQTRRELDTTRSRLTSLLFTTLFLLFDFFRPPVGIWSKYSIKLYFQNSPTQKKKLGSCSRDLFS